MNFKNPWDACPIRSHVSMGEGMVRGVSVFRETMALSIFTQYPAVIRYWCQRPSPLFTLEGRSRKVGKWLRSNEPPVEYLRPWMSSVKSRSVLELGSGTTFTPGSNDFNLISSANTVEDKTYQQVRLILLASVVSVGPDTDFELAGDWDPAIHEWGTRLFEETTGKCSSAGQVLIQDF